jgi:Phosphotransferase enzyme family
MASGQQNGQENCRVVVLRRGGSEVLFQCDGDQFAFPSVAVPPGHRVAETLTTAIKAECGEEVVCLFEANTMSSTDDTKVHFQAAEHWRTSSRPKLSTRWLPMAALSQDSLIDPRDFSAIREVVAQCDAALEDSSPGPFARLGWFRELREWISRVIEPQGLHLEDNFHQINASPSFSLIRFETDGPALWFKAVGKPNEKEFPITCTLARLFPNYLPPLLGVRPDWNGWLAHEAKGRKLDEAQEITDWKATASALARLQIESIDHEALILSVGARDLRPVALASLVQPFIEMMTQLMGKQTKVPPAVLCREELLSLGDCIHSALAALEAVGIPPTLGHLDLNPGNIIVSPTRCVFLDWAEAYVGNPVLSFEYVLEHLRGGAGMGAPAEAMLIESYCAEWEQVVSPAALDEALRFGPLLAAFAYAAGNDVWGDEQRLEDLDVAGYMRSLARRMYREANELMHRRSVCPH